MSSLNKLYQFSLDQAKSTHSKKVFSSILAAKYSKNKDDFPIIEKFHISQDRVSEEEGLNKENLEGFTSVLGSSEFTLEKVYAKREKISIIILVIALILIISSLIFLFYLAWYFFSQGEDVTTFDSWKESILSIVTLIIGSTLMVFYNREKKSMTEIEGDLRFWSRLQGYATVLKSIDSNELKMKIISEINKLK